MWDRLQKNLKMLTVSVVAVLVSCTPQEGGEKAVQVETAGIFEPVTLTVVGGEKLGDVLTASEAVDREILITNNSEYDITHMDLVMDPDGTAAMKFRKGEGESVGRPEYPGSSPSGLGICNKETRKLAPGESCSIWVTYTPSRSGEFDHAMTFIYRNLVDSDKVSIKFTVRSGDPASLINIDDKKAYDFGVFERTDRIVRTQTIQVENRGGLPATDVQVRLEDPEDPPAYKIVSHNCPEKIEVKEACQIIVSYEPQNWDIGDTEEVSYTANLFVDYKNDPAGTQSSPLGAQFQFISTSIKANFNTTVSDVNFTPDTIVGNKESKGLKVKNDGWREGIMKKVIFRDALDNHKATCIKVDGTNELECQDESGVALTLEQWPFRISESQPCMDVETAGKTISQVGASCFFQLTFWPSIAYETARDFAGTKIYFEYDSRWKNNVDIVTEELFTVNANSVPAGKLQIQGSTYGLTTLTNSGDPLGVSFFDLGRVALISNAAYGTALSFQVKNIGGSQVTITSIQDGQASPNSINSSQQQLLHNGDGSYYRNTSSDCSVLQPGDTCSLLTTFTPLNYPSKPDPEAYQYSMMADVIPDPVVLDTDRYKRFIFSYEDSATFNDDGSAHEERVIENRYSAVLVTKGFLVYQDQTAGNIGNSNLAGTTVYHRVILENVGTGTIPYIKVDDTDNLNYDCGPPCPTTYAFKIIDMDPPGGIDLDCYDLLDTPSPSFFDLGHTPQTPAQWAKPGLPPGQTCALTVQTEIPNNAREWCYKISCGEPEDIEHEREFHHLWNNTADAYEYAAWNTADTLSFQYYDGDKNLGLAPPYYDAYGFYQDMANYAVSVGWSLRATLSAELPTPLQSAVIHRPTINLPAISGETGSEGPYTIAEFWQPLAGTETPYSSAAYSIPHAAGVIAGGYSYTLHAGTFPADNAAYPFSMRLSNYGDRSAVVDSWTFTTTDDITMTSSHGPTPFNIFGGGNNTVTFQLKTTTPGIHEGTLDIQYNNGLTTLTKSFRVVAEAISSPPKLELDVEDITVVYDVGPPESWTETPAGNTGALALGYNNDTASGGSTQFEAVQGSAVYALKEFTIKNNSGVTVNNLNTFLKTTVNAVTGNVGSGPVSSTGMDSTCSGISLANGSTCTFRVKWAPGASQSDVTRYLTFSYEIATNQWINQITTLNFKALAPADVKVAGGTEFQILDNSSGFTETSNPVGFGNFTDTPHIYTATWGQNFTVGPIDLTNTSDLTASFLSELPGAPAPPGAPVLMKTLYGGLVNVYASRECFYGDSQGDQPVDEEGFNNASTTPCSLTFHYAPDETFAGELIDPSDMIFPLEFYNNKRSSTEKIWFHFTGFVEPNHSNAAGDYSNVETSDTGTASFSWPAMSEVDINWGSIIGYRIYRSDFESILDNVNTTTAEYNDVGPAVTSYIWTGLSKAKYHYFKVAAIRQKNLKTYISEGNLGVLKVVVPPVGVLYRHDLGANGALIDRGLTSGFGYRSEALSACSTTKYVIKQGATNTNVWKELIDTSIWNFIKSDPDQAQFTTYSDYVPIAVSHQLADPKTDIKPIFQPLPGGFDTTITTHYVGDPYEYLYQKPCQDDSCNMQHKIVGGDGAELPIDATLYIDGETAAGAYRCWAEI